MSEYIHTNKFDTNESPNIFVTEKLIRTNVRINIRDQYIRIFEYSNIFVTLWSVVPLAMFFLQIRALPDIILQKNPILLYDLMCHSQTWPSSNDLACLFTCFHSRQGTNWTNLTISRWLGKTCAQPQQFGNQSRSCKLPDPEKFTNSIQPSLDFKINIFIQKPRTHFLL